MADVGILRIAIEDGALLQPFVLSMRPVGIRRKGLDPTGFVSKATRLIDESCRHASGPFQHGLYI